jgi:hypothetical protein
MKVAGGSSRLALLLFFIAALSKLWAPKSSRMGAKALRRRRLGARR